MELPNRSVKHPGELPDEILTALGFSWLPSPYSDVYGWTHQRSAGKFCFHVMTAGQVASALIEIGHNEFRRRAESEIASIEMPE